MKRSITCQGVYLTVGELRQLISDVPDNFVVLSEGCDCTERSMGIDIDDETGELTIAR